MKEKVIYKSSSFSLNLFILFLGFVFFSLMIWLCIDSLKTNKDEDDIIAVYTISSVFFIGAIGCLFYFLSTQIIKLTNKNLIISYQFLPFSKKILIDDIVNFKQKSLPVKHSRYLFDKGKTVHNFFETLIDLENGGVIKIYSLNEFDFKEIQKLIGKIRRGESTLQVEKISKIELVIQNIPLILFLIMLVILIGGLSNALVFN